MSNPFDRFDAPAGGANPFDRFEAKKPVQAPEELSGLEKFAASLPDWMAGSSGGVRGSAVGRAMMGAADPGVAAFQLAANVVGAGDSVNKAVADTEAKYQAARKEAGSEGFDPMRMVGNIAITAPLAGVGGAARTLSAAAGKGAIQGAGLGALQPVTDAAEGFWGAKGKQAGVGAVGGAILAPVAAGVARLVSPAASVNPNIARLREEGVRPTVGQTLGGWANAAEEKLQSLPIMGDAIRAMRGRATDQFRKAALDRAAKPIGVKVEGDGYEAIGELSRKIGQAYDDVLPRMKANVLDSRFVDRVSKLRSGVQSGFLPDKEKAAFDAIIAREIDGRVSPNGTISGQGLKEAWISLRETGNKFAKSQDPYQADLGKAVKQLFTELKNHVTASNSAADVSKLRNADLAWANFKRVQKAAGQVGAEEGRFTPAQLNSAVKAMDKSKDKARFSEGDALMQDLSSAGRSTLTGKVPDSGTPTRMAWGAGALATGAISPAIPASLVAGAAMYAPPVQNALVALISRRPDIAPQIADYIRRATPALTVGTVPALEQMFAQ